MRRVCLTRNGYISPLWTKEKLEMITDARRALGYAGTFVNFRALVHKFLSPSTIEEAMELRPKSTGVERLVSVPLS